MPLDISLHLEMNDDEYTILQRYILLNVGKKKFVPQLSLSHYISLPAHESSKPWGSRSETDRQTISGNSWENIRQRNLKWSSCSGLQCSNTNETRFLLASSMSATTPRCLLSLAFTHTLLFNCKIYVHISWSWKILLVLSDLKTVPFLYKLIYRKTVIISFNTETSPNLKER